MNNCFLKVALGLGIGLFGISIGARAQDSPASRSSSEPQPDRVVIYKTVGDHTLKMHLFLPEDFSADDSRPAIVFFFGGGWVNGSPQQFYNQCRYLAGRGMVAASAEYRIRSKHQTTPAECVKDGKSAVRWLRSQAEQWGIDPNRLAAAGGSAGGHVAAATATVNGFEEDGEDSTVSCRPNALVLFNPVFDNSEKGYGYDRVQDYWEQISPLHNLTDKTPPTIVFLGTKDKLIPVETAERYRDKMRQLGQRCELVLYPDQPHGFFNRGKSFADTLRQTDRFLAELGFLSGEPGATSLESIAGSERESSEEANSTSKDGKQRNR